jgi:hypothetical protein
MTNVDGYLSPTEGMLDKWRQHNDVEREIALEPRRSWNGGTWDDIQAWANETGQTQTVLDPITGDKVIINPALSEK